MRIAWIYGYFISWCVDLVCGSNNCRNKFGLYYHEKDDCCEKKENIVTTIRPKWG